MILVTGATGYIGGRLVPRLLDAGYRVRVLVRDPSRLQGREWLAQVEVAEGDVLRPETLPAALNGVTAAYYLVHSMGAAADFTERDVRAARAFGNAASAAQLKRIIYLGGLGDQASNLSRHLRSRQETGVALRESGVPVTEFRAAIVVGSGSISFELIRDLTEHMPVVFCPRWVETRVQPIAIRDVQSYLLAALTTPESAGKIVEIGGTDVLTYHDMMIAYARARGLRRVWAVMSFLTPRMCAYWVHWMTPLPPMIVRPLIEGMMNEVIVRDDAARKLFPQIQPIGYNTALGLALARLEAGQVETSWTDALSTTLGDSAPVKLTEQEGIIVEQRTVRVAATAHDVFSVFIGLGGARGWLYANWLWRLRGILDRVIGGVGFRRGRRHPDELHVGDALDFWRVEVVEEDHLLRLRAEMRVPGSAWLQFEADPHPDGGALLTQTAFFTPKGLTGHIYWYFLYPIHGRIFRGMIRAIGRRAERTARTPGRMEAA